MLKVCDAPPGHTNALLKVNLTRWECGHGEDRWVAREIAAPESRELSARSGAPTTRGPVP